MRVRTVGAGSPVVLVHGLAGSPRWWRRIAPALAVEHTVHLVDLPARRVLESSAVVDSLAALGPASYVGHSLGGLLAVRLAARRPDAVKRLALVAPAGIPGRSAAASIAPVTAAVLRAGPAFLSQLAFDTLRGGPVSVLAAGRRLLADDVRPELAAVRAPTLLLWGDRDPLLPHAHAQEFLEALGDARLELIAGAAHVPMLDRPDEVSRALLRFLAPAA